MKRTRSALEQAPRECPYPREGCLARVKPDDQLFVDDRLHFFAGRNVGDFALESVAIDGQPVRHRNNLRELEIADRELARFRFVLDRDFIAGLHVVGSDVDAASVDLNMAVRHELARSIASVSEAEPVNHIIEAGLKKLEQGFTRYTTFAQRVLENAAELAFEKSILITKLL